MLRCQREHKELEVVKLLCSAVAHEPEVGEKNGGQIRTQREKLTQESLESSLYLTLRWPSFPRGGRKTYPIEGCKPLCLVNVDTLSPNLASFFTYDAWV